MVMIFCQTLNIIFIILYYYYIIFASAFARVLGTTGVYLDRQENVIIAHFNRCSHDIRCTVIFRLVL